MTPVVLVYELTGITQLVRHFPYTGADAYEQVAMCFAFTTEEESCVGIDTVSSP